MKNQNRNVPLHNPFDDSVREECDSAFRNSLSQKRVKISDDALLMAAYRLLLEVNARNDSTRADATNSAIAAALDHARVAMKMNKGAIFPTDEILANLVRGRRASLRASKLIPDLIVKE